MATVTLTLEVDASRLEVARQLIEGIKGVKIKKAAIKEAYDNHPVVKDLKASIQEVNDIIAGKAQGIDAKQALADLQKELGHEF